MPQQVFHICLMLGFKTVQKIETPQWLLEVPAK